MKVWTFRIRGATPFSVKVPDGPTLEHTGPGETLWKMVGRYPDASFVRNLIEAIDGVTVEIFSEGQTEEQTALRGRRASFGDPRDGFVFRTKRCPECFFFDQELPNHCGLSDWEKDTTSHALADPKAYADAFGCPLVAEAVKPG